MTLRTALRSRFVFYCSRIGAFSLRSSSFLLSPFSPFQSSCLTGFSQFFADFFELSCNFNIVSCRAYETRLGMGGSRNTLHSALQRQSDSHSAPSGIRGSPRAPSLGHARCYK